MCAQSWDRNVYALSSFDGSVLWSVKLNGSISSSPAVHVGLATLYVGCYDNRLYALNEADGVVKWSFNTGGGLIRSVATCTCTDVVCCFQACWCPHPLLVRMVVRSLAVGVERCLV